ncbi:hypothetical protein C2869_12090 [Saccharobesus litoralis]|uniref:DUF3379 domain-containing protein n=1 Tax=Saccharobesus litoralis TaxID=2172099 RepID=A0A2S0VSD4_9ALTE|nr:DUF3379 family protein [Saccharobesus litoralis]AWB67128.1 hypothetical protein C2869_12090 [Saccharobesus litoralis]
MDDLEFRRQVIADPKAIDEDLQQSIDADPAKQQLQQDMLNLDDKISKAMHVSVPDGLEQRLILKQSIESYKQQERHKQRWSLSIAASVAFAAALGVSAWIYQPVNTSEVGLYALEHLHHELSYSSAVDENVSLEQLNAKLASFGGKLNNAISHVSYANYCNLNGLKSLHLVMQGEHGQVTVFVLPKSNELSGWHDFSDDRFSGTAHRFKEADMIVIGEKNENIQSFSHQLSNNISWAI